jgi:putative membrane protein
MVKTNIFLLGTGLALVSVGCAGSSTKTETLASEPARRAPAPAPSHSDARTMGEAPAEPGPGQLLALGLALDEIAVEAAAAGEERGLDPRVREFARRMRADHQDDLARGQALGIELGVVPSPAPETERLRNQAALALTEARAEPGESFDRRLMELVIEQHAQALGVLDARLIPVAEGKLREHLVGTRAAVLRHLEEARTLRDQLIEAPIAKRPE